MKKSSRTKVKDEIDKCIELTLSAGEGVLIDAILGKLLIEIEEALSGLLRNNLIGANTVSVSVPDGPNSARIFVRLEAKPF